MAGTCEYGEELSGSINAGNFLSSGKVYRLASQEGLCSMEKISIGTINSNDRITETLYSLRTWFVSGIYV